MKIFTEVDKSFVALDEEITYRINIENIFQEKITDIKINKLLPDNVKFIEGKMERGKTQVVIEGEINGVLKELNPEEKIEILIKGRVESIPQMHFMTNTIDASYKNNETEQEQIVSTNTVMTVVNDPKMREEDCKCSVDKESVGIDEKLTYTIQIANKGNVRAYGIQLENIIPKGTIPVVENQYIIECGDMDINESKEFTYQVQVIQKESPWIITQQPLLTYTFLLADRRRIARSYLLSPMTTKVRIATFEGKEGFNKRYSKTVCDLGEKIKCYIELKNNGNLDAYQVEVIDSIPEGLSVVDKAYKNRFTIPEIKSQQIIQLDYEVEVVSVHEMIISEQVHMTYCYKHDNVEKQGKTSTNTTYLAVKHGELSTEKTENRTVYLTLNEEKDVFIQLYNDGNIETDLFKIEIPISNIYDVQGVEWEKTETCYRWEGKKGVKPHEKVEVKLNLRGKSIESSNKCTVTAMCYYSYIVGEEKIEIQKEMVSKIDIYVIGAFIQGKETTCYKKVSSEKAKIGDVLNYTLEIYNDGNISANQIEIQEILPPEISYEKNTLIINGIEQYQDLYQPIKLEHIGCGDYCCIQYSAQIAKIPKEGDINPTTKITYMYGEEGRLYTKTLVLEGACTQIKMAHIQIVQYQQVLESEYPIAIVGDQITCQVLIANEGNIEAEEVMLEDGNEILVGVIKPYEKKEITYTRQIPYLSNEEIFEHTMRIKYEYQGIGKDTQEEIVEKFVPIRIKDAYMGEGSDGILFYGSHEYAQLGDEIIYSVLLKNGGNVEAEKIEVILPEIEKCEWTEIRTDKSQEMNTLNLLPKQSIELCYRLKVGGLPQKEQIEVAPIIRYIFRQEEVLRNRIYELPTLITPIRYAKLDVEESWEFTEGKRSWLTIGDRINYSIKIHNSGNQVAQNIVLQQWISEGLVCNQGNIQINGVSYNDIIVTEPIQLVEIEVGEITHIVYQLEVCTLPTQSYVEVVGTLQYSYEVGEDKKEIISKIEQFQSKEVSVKATLIEQKDNNLLYTTEQKQVDQKDIIEYTVYCRNGGNCIAENMVYRGILSDGLTYKEKSMRINGEPIEENVIEGITVGDLIPNQEIMIVFQAKVDEGILYPSIWSKGYIVYEIESEQITTETNKLEHTVQTAGPLLPVDFEQDIQPCKLEYNDKMILKWKIFNRGNLVMNNTMLTLPPSWVEIIKVQRVSVNNRVLNQLSIVEGIPVGDVIQGDWIEIMMEGMVKSIPKKAVEESVSITYGYYSQPNLMKKVTKYSTKGKIEIKDTGLKNKENCVLKVDKKYVVTGDTIGYQLIISNAGNQAIHNIQISICGNEEMTWPIFREKQIEAYEVRTFYFECEAPNINEVEEVIIEAKITYFYYDYTGKMKKCEQWTNQVKTLIKNAVFTQESFIKSITPREVTIGEVVKYQIKCKNKGNTTAEEVKLYQKCPPGIKLVETSIKQDGQTRWLEEGAIILERLKPSVESIITFEAIVERWDTNQDNDITYIGYTMMGGGEKISDEKRSEKSTANIEVFSSNIQITCESIDEISVVGEDVCYKIAIKNRGNRAAHNLKWKNNLDDILSVYKESIERYQIEGAEYLESNKEIMWEICGKLVSQNPKKIYEFKPVIQYEMMLRNEKHTLQAEGQIQRQQIGTANVELVLKNEKDIKNVSVGDRLTYYVEIINTGTLIAKQIIFYAQIPKGATFVPGTLKIQGQHMGTPYIEQGITIGELQPEEKRQLSYVIQIDDYCKRQVNTQAYCVFHYMVSNKGGMKRKITNTHEEILKVSIPNQKQKIVTVQIILPYGYGDMETIEAITVQAEVQKIHWIQKGENLVVVYGKLEYVIEYKTTKGKKEKLVKNQVIQEEMTLYTKGMEINDVEMDMIVTNNQYGMIHGRQISIVSFLTTQEK